VTLADAGFRFLVSKDRKLAKWVHMLEVVEDGSTDCTDMDDDEFLEFIKCSN
jgi:hypothetical protein